MIVRLHINHILKGFTMKNHLFIGILVLMSVFVTHVATAQQKCRIEIVDVASGEIAVVRQFDSRVEAPEWSRDGKWLYYNTGGSIFKISPNGGEPVKVPTGDIASCNNDHVISPDGKTLAISVGVPGKGSVIFTLPIDGGTPRQVTPEGPSYLHGWSPDGKKLVYTAQRNGDYDIYIISLDGSDETQLTDVPGLDDGPEFTPDGKRIWFCSVRSGLMQLWSMNPDGTDQKRMLDEEANCWFPHVSPDGKSVSYLTYRKGDVDPSDHPANREVCIKVMPIGGGESKTLVELFGGQGTMNVNSWSPDSKKIAYVHFERP